MQAYARVELAPAEPAFSDEQARRPVSDGPANQPVADSNVGRAQSVSAALAAVLLDGLDGDALGVLAKRLMPLLRRLENANEHVGHLAYTVDSLAAELRVSPKTIRCAIARGELRGVKRGSRWIISADAVREWASSPKPRRTRGSACRQRAPKTAGPSLRSVLCEGQGS